MSAATIRAELAELHDEIAAKYRYYEALREAQHAAEQDETHHTADSARRAEYALNVARKLHPVRTK